MKKSSEVKTSPISIECLGGDGGVVTGSCHKIISKDAAVFIDHGLFQGLEERTKRGERRNFVPAASIASGVRDILITHPHIDHSGLVPNIFKNGLTPRILATETTAAFMGPMLYNSAGIQEKESDPLYSKYDVDKTLKYLKIVDPFQPISIGEKHGRSTATFLPNGHVMGSCSILVHAEGGDRTKHILFTGDMGKPYQSLCGGHKDQVAHYPTDPIHVLVVESTNFERRPFSFEEKMTNFLKGINTAWNNGGNPIVPCLSFHRLQELMEIIHNCQGNLIPRDCKIFIDAPFGVALLESFRDLDADQLSRRYGDNPDFYKTDQESLARFDIKNLTIIDTHQDSVANDASLASYRGKCIIIASGGMGEHGRVVNYLQGKFAKNPKNSILFICHQVEGTTGHALVRAKNVSQGKTRGARVENIEGFTSHISGPEETFGYLTRYNLGCLETVVITHGKDSARTAMAQEFKRRGYDTNIVLPALNQVIET